MSTLTIKPRENQTRNVLESIVIGVVITALSYFVGVKAHWLAAASIHWLEVFAVFTSYCSTYLCVTERRLNYPFGAISSAAYAYLFWQSGLLASTVLNAYLVPTLIYGWLRWRKDHNTRPVTHIQLKWIPAYLAIAGFGYTGAAMLSSRLGGHMAWTDSVILAGTILAQFLLDNKKLENWIIWAVVNVFAIYTYATSGLPLVAFQYVFFLANTIYGYVIWNRSKKNVQRIYFDDSNATNHGTLAIDPVR
jgi:nicotinamide mononucleotide transporter